MSKIVYNKLIRDKVPEAIERTGKAFATHIISEDEYQLYLRHKLHEETTEYLESDDISELADLVEAIHALVKARASHGRISRKSGMRNSQSVVVSTRDYAWSMLAAMSVSYFCS